MDQLTKRAKAPELLVRLERGRSHGPLSAQLERELREAVRSGRLRAGTPLPSTRALALELGIARGLVVAAYAQLGAEGYLQLRRNAPPLVAEAVGSQAPARTLAADPLWRYNLRPDLPDYGAFPREEWLTSYRAAVKRAPDAELGYGDVRGVAELREGLVADPSHAVIREIVARSGVEPVPIPVDEEGVDVDALARAAPDAVLLSPAHQFPTGVVLSPERRARVLAWADERDAFVLEDDYDAEFRYDRPPVGALQGLRPERVVYCGSASKTLAPTLRLGWVVAPPRLVHALVEQVLYTTIAPPRLEQLAFADFLARGELDRHLRRMRLRYRRRRDALVSSLARELPEVEVRGVAAGLYVAAVLPDGVDETRVLVEARARGIGVYGMGQHCAQVEREPALLLGYAFSPEPTIRAAVRKLAEAVAAASA
jgi:GntR family transcriptional regulator / MocR family aminotransferase